jgi:hypothetical protein
MRSTQALVVAIAMAALLFSVRARADDASDDDDAAIAWRAGVGLAIATVASAGLVGALTTEPLKQAREKNPEALLPTPKQVAIAQGLAGLGIGLFCAVGAVVTVPHAR